MVITSLLCQLIFIDVEKLHNILINVESRLKTDEHLLGFFKCVFIDIDIYKEGTGRNDL